MAKALRRRSRGSMRRSARWPARPTAPSPSRSTTAASCSRMARSTERRSRRRLRRSRLPDRARLRRCRHAPASARARPPIARPTGSVDLMEQECERLGLARRSRRRTRQQARRRSRLSLWRARDRAGRRRGRGRELAASTGRASRRQGGAVEPVLTKLPGYPARLAAGADGGAWLCLFAPRNRLIEFVLEEDAYRADMMREVAREHWIAPALSSGTSFLEPLQCGGVKTMGIHKPWSPTRSYGLLVRLDRNLRPVASFHSRANGRRHGITSVVERDRTRADRRRRAAMPSSVLGGGADDRRSSRCRRSPRPIAACRPSRTSISTCARARSTRCSARTAPASRR